MNKRWLFTEKKYSANAKRSRQLLVFLENSVIILPDYPDNDNLKDIYNMSEPGKVSRLDPRAKKILELSMSFPGYAFADEILMKSC